MRNKAKEIVQAILDAADDPQVCQEYRQAIPGYVEAELNSQTMETLYPELAQHLAACPGCSEEYADLRLILELERGEQLLEPPRSGVFDPSFLDQAPAKPPLWQTTRDNVRRLVAEITAQLGPQLVRLTDLPQQLLPYRAQLAPAATFRATGSAETGDGAGPEKIDLPDPEANVRLRIITGPVEAGQGTVVVQVETLESPQPIQRVWVTLYDKDLHLLESGLTTARGRMIFKELNAGEYIIQVEHQQWQWRIDLTLQAEQA